MDDLKRDWNSSRNFDMGSWFDGTSLNKPATLLRNAEHSADVLSFMNDTKMRLWPIFLRCKWETTCLANCAEKDNQTVNRHGDNRNRNSYLHRWDLYFRNWRCLNVHRQDRCDGLKLTNQIVAKISLIVPLKQKLKFLIKMIICMELFKLYLIQVWYLQVNAVIIQRRITLKWIDAVRLEAVGAREERWKWRLFTNRRMASSMREHRRRIVVAR